MPPLLGLLESAIIRGSDDEEESESRILNISGIIPMRHMSPRWG